jgi:hypothetical protein
VEEVLAIAQDDQRFIARLLLEGAGAVDLELEPAYREHLQEIVKQG